MPETYFLLEIVYNHPLRIAAMKIYINHYVWN